MPKSGFNKVASSFIEISFIEIFSAWKCSPVNLLHIFRTPFSKNTSGRLFVKRDSGTDFFL